MASTTHPPLTARDRELLEFLAEQRVAATSQLRALLRCSERALQVRLDRLEQRMLLRVEQIFAGQPAAVWIRGTGLAMIGRRLRPPRRNLQALRHDIGVGWVSLAARRGVFGPLQSIVSEREMRSHDGRAGNEADGDKYGIGLWRQSGRRPGSNRHYPDLLLQTRGGQWVAIELELTGKSNARLRDIMSAYAIDRRYARVLYLVPDRRLGNRIRAAARTAGADTTVAIQLVDGDKISGAASVSTAASISTSAPSVTAAAAQARVRVLCSTPKTEITR